MLGHRLMLHLADEFDVVGTVRRLPAWLDRRPAERNRPIATNIDATDLAGLAAFLDDHKPDVVLNCIGIVKQLAEARDPIKSIEINALFPHLLARLCADRGARLIHFSTDCVFAGTGGPYRQDAVSDARDLYGRSKYLGEVGEMQNALTIRSSIIGHEFDNKTGLMEWILTQKGRTASGFAQALYTGVTTIEMAKTVERLIKEFPSMWGVWQFSSPQINKFDLVRLVNEVYSLGIDVRRDDEFFCDRRLDGTLFERETGIVSGSWDEMVRAQYEIYLSEYKNG